MVASLTRRESDVLEAVKAYGREHGGEMPTCQELGAMLGLVPSWIFYLLRRLQDKGLIEFGGRWRGIVLREAA